MKDRRGSIRRSRDSWSRSSTSAQRRNCEVAIRYSSECHSSPALTSCLSARSISSQPVDTRGSCHDPAVGKRSRNRKTVTTSDFSDDEGNVLTLRHTDAKVPEPDASAAASADDLLARRNEIRFERYVVRWVISGLEYEKQKELLARYRMADSGTQEWVQRTIDRHTDAA